MITTILRGVIAGIAAAWVNEKLASRKSGPVAAARPVGYHVIV